MAVNTDHTGSTQVFNAHGKALAITKLAKNNMTQAELTAAIQFIQETATVVGIADDTTGGFNTGASDAVHVLSEGVAPVAGADFGIGSTGVTASVVAYFQAD